MWTSAELKLRAKGAFYKNYWHCVLVALVMSFFIGVTAEDLQKWFTDIDHSFFIYNTLQLQVSISAIGIGYFLLKIFLGNVLIVGGCRFFIKNQIENPHASELGFAMTSNGYGNVVQTMFLKNLYTSLWTLLLVVPGIIKRYEYLMIPYILAENPEMDREEAFLISKRMMDGEKLNAFGLELSFVGWGLVDILTFGILGVFFVQPYYQATLAELYSVNRAKAYQEGYIR